MAHTNPFRDDQAKKDEDKDKKPLPRTTQPSEDIAAEPAAERGERIDTGKAIHRGGKTEGKVPGAEEQKP